LEGVQAAPSWQEMHWPAWQTIPAPQEVPFGWLSDSVQTGAPVVQVIIPLRHGLPVTAQLPPAAQPAQAPLLQTIP
jgi:hypothetical protein